MPSTQRSYTEARGLGHLVEVHHRLTGATGGDVGEPATTHGAGREGLAAVQVLTGIPTGVLMRPLGYLADENREDLTVRGLIAGR